MSKLVIGILLCVIAQIFVFIQVQGSLKYQSFKDYKWIVILMSIPISWIFIESVKYIYDWSDGQLWPSRLIGFSVGIIVFTIMSLFLFGEGISMKTGTCLILSAIILIIQIFWK